MEELPQKVEQQVDPLQQVLAEHGHLIVFQQKNLWWKAIFTPKKYSDTMIRTVNRTKSGAMQEVWDQYAKGYLVYH